MHRILALYGIVLLFQRSFWQSQSLHPCPFTAFCLAFRFGHALSGPKGPGSAQSFWTNWGDGSRPTNAEPIHSNTIMQEMNSWMILNAYARLLRRSFLENYSKFDCCLRARQTEYLMTDSEHQHGSHHYTQNKVRFPYGKLFLLNDGFFTDLNWPNARKGICCVAHNVLQRLAKATSDSLWFNEWQKKESAKPFAKPLGTRKASQGQHFHKRLPCEVSSIGILAVHIYMHLTIEQNTTHMSPRLFPSTFRVNLRDSTRLCKLVHMVSS